MDQKGQISIEFVLIIAFMLVLVLLVASYVGEQNELNNVLSAARVGASDAATNLSLLNRSMTPVRVDDIFTTGSGQNLTITIQIDGSISDYQNQTIVNGTLSSIAAQGYTLTGNRVITSRHVYNVTLI